MAEEIADQLEENTDTENEQKDEGKGDKEKTFTQAEVDSLIKERTGRYSKQLQELKASVDDYSKQISELTEQFNSTKTEAEQLKAEKARNEIVAEVAKETGLSERVVSLLRGDDKESLMDAANEVKPKSAPHVSSDGNAPDKHTNENLEAAKRLFGG